jgi:outer membrane protein OmpA-like peptidoglycan-associated protein
MDNAQQQATGTRSGKELAMLVGVLLMVVAGTLTTYWVSSRSTEEAPAKPDVVTRDVYFDFKSARLRADAVRVLQDTVKVMDRVSTWVVLVQGYADRQGPPEYNRVLATRRADAVKQFLLELGVQDASVKVVTIGQYGALCDDPSQECQQQNRRVHVEIRKLAP